jgi:hypothetical protein
MQGRRTGASAPVRRLTGHFPKSRRPQRMILIIAPGDDVHVLYVTRFLEQMGESYLRFDPQDFPGSTAVSVELDRSGAVRGSLFHAGGELPLDRIRAVWNRARVRPKAPPAVNPDQVWWVEESCTRFLSELYECIDCLWLPERPSSDREPFRVYNPADKSRGANPTRLRHPSAYNKLHQLRLAGQLGFILPRTLMSNEPGEVLGFFEACEGQVISKRAAHLVTFRGGEKTTPFTVQMRRRDLANVGAVRFAPAVFQENVPKDVELRVTVVGDEVFPAEIRSQESVRWQVDWRHTRDFGGASFYSVAQLPPQVSRRCVDLVRELGLSFGAIDLIRRPDGEYVFLEVNPNGQWAWVEDYTGLPIGQAIARLLAQVLAAAPKTSKKEQAWTAA